jgi:hypothetical protein
MVKNSINLRKERTITSHLNLLNTKKRPRHMSLEIQVLAVDRHTDVAVLSWLMTSHASYNKDKIKTISDLQRNKENQLE